MRHPDPELDELFRRLLSDYENGRGPIVIDLSDEENFVRQSNNIVSGMRHRLREYEGIRLKSRNNYDKCNVTIELLDA